jgi:hypothetical protein
LHARCVPRRMDCRRLKPGVRPDGVARQSSALLGVAGRATICGRCASAFSARVESSGGHSGAPRSGEPGIHNHRPVNMDSGPGPPISGLPEIGAYDAEAGGRTFGRAERAEVENGLIVITRRRRAIKGTGMAQFPGSKGSLMWSIRSYRSPRRGSGALSIVDTSGPTQLRGMRRSLSVCRFRANVEGDDSRRARHLAFKSAHSHLVVAARALRRARSDPQGRINGCRTRPLP